jgi:hypothetical protein
VPLLLLLGLMPGTTKQRSAVLDDLKRKIGADRLASCGESALALATEAPSGPIDVWLLLQLAAISKTCAVVRQVFQNGMASWLNHVNPFVFFLMSKFATRLFRVGADGDLKAMREVDAIGPWSECVVAAYEILTEALYASRGCGREDVIRRHEVMAEIVGFVFKETKFLWRDLSTFGIHLLAEFAGTTASLFDRRFLQFRPQVELLFKFEPQGAPDGLVAAVEAFVCSFSALLAARSAFVDFSVGNECPLGEVEALRNAIVTLPPCLFGTGDLIQNLSARMSKFDAVRLAMRSILSARDWYARTFNCPPPPLPDLEDRQVTDAALLKGLSLTKQNDLLQQMWGTIGIEKKLAERVGPLAAAKNAIFTAIVVAAASEGPSLASLDPNERPRRVTELLSGVTYFLERLVREPQHVRFGDVRAKFSGSISNLSPDRMFDQVRGLCDALIGSTAGANPAKTADRLVRALAAAKLSANVTAMSEVLRRLGLKAAESKELVDLRELVRDLEGSTDVTLEEMDARVDRVKSMCNGIESFQMSYFSAVNVNGVEELVAFLRRQGDFAGRVEILRQQVQGGDFHTRLLDNLQVAANFLQPFVSPSAETSTLSSIAEDVRRIVPEVAVLKQLGSIRQSCDNFNQITELFSSFDSFSSARIVFLINRYVRSARFESVSDESTPAPSAREQSSSSASVRHGERNLLRLVAINEATEEALARDQLDDVVRGAELSKSDEQGGGEGDAARAAVVSFLRSYELAERAHSVRMQLARLGHPLHQQGVKMIGRVGDVSAVENVLSQFQNELSTWKKALEAACREHPRLLFVSPTILRNALVRQESRASLPFVVFPDRADEPLTLDLHSSKFDVLTPEQKLAALGEGLSALAGDETGESPTARTFGDEVVPLFNATEASIFARLCAHFEAPPHPSQVMYCSATTSAGEVAQFMRRTNSFPHLTFAVVAPNALTPIAREEFLRGHNERYMAWRQEKDRGQSSVLMLFTGNEGLDVMHVADRGGEQPVLTKEEVEGPRMHAWITASCISALEWVTSNHPRVGKSHYIKSKVGVGEYVRVQVQEGFDGAYLLKRVSSKCLGRGELVLHFDLCFKPELWGAFNAALNDLIGFGTIANSLTGEVLRLSQRKVRIYVEVPNVDKMEMKGWKGHLPFSAVGRHVDLSKKMYPLRFLTDEEKKKVCVVGAFIRLRQAQQILMETLATLPVITPDDAATLVAQQLVGLGMESRDRAFEVAFIRMMEERCQYLLRLAAFCRNARRDEETPLARNKNIMNPLFESFCREVVGVLSRDQSSYSGKCIVARNIDDSLFYFSLYYTPANATNLSLQPHWVQGFKGNFHIESWSCPENSTLRAHLGSALGIADTSRVAPILERKDFVLTPDFAAKLIALNERRCACENVVIVGETGVGKVV